MEIAKEKTVAFIGHRTLISSNLLSGRNFHDVIKAELSYLIRDLYDDGYKTFLSGMSLGFDMISAEVVIEFKKHHPDVKLYAVIPFQGQELHYPKKDIARYTYIYERCDRQIYVSEFYTSSTDYLKRNDYLIANSSLLVCYCDMMYECVNTSFVKKAYEAGLEVVNLYE